MAKKQTKQQDDQPDIPGIKTKSFGIYLNKELTAEVIDIAHKETSDNYHALLQFAIKYFIKEYRAGRVKLKKRTVTKLELD
jgi:hypothetical protein